MTTAPPAPSALARALNGGATKPVAQSASQSLLAKALVAGPRGEVLELPGLGTVRLEIVGARTQQEIVAAVRREMARLDVPFDELGAVRWNAEEAIRTLAESARDPADRSVPFGSLDEWGRVDTPMINASWQIYGDLIDRLDPLSKPITNDEALIIELAIKKKDRVQLRSFGVAKLAAYVTSTDVQLATSQQPRSSNSDSSSEPSPSTMTQPT
jgi:hypothetical protein